MKKRKSFKKSDITSFYNRNRYIIRNGDHIGIYKYVCGYMMINRNLTKSTSSEGFNVLYKVYDTIEERNKETLLRYSHNTIKSNDISDLVMVSEIYEIPSYINFSNKKDVEDLKTAFYMDGDFYENLRELVVNRWY